MTKYLNLFLLFIIVGIGITFGYFFWKKGKVAVVTRIVPTEEKFSIEPAPKQSRKGIVTSISGQILWQSRIATIAAEVKDIKIIQQGELLGTGKDSIVSAVFSDAAIVNLSSDSEIEFLQTLPVNFVFRQNKGEINYLKKGLVPLSVRSLHLLMTFADGEYLLNTDVDKHTLELTVKKGMVKVAYNNIDYETQSAEINEGEKFVFNDDDRVGEIK